MATMNFSVPDDVKESFDKAFEGENKSAVLTRLMRRAVNEHERQKQRMAVVSTILDLRAKALRFPMTKFANPEQPTVTRLVVDASVAVKWFLHTPTHSQSRRRRS